MAQITIDTVVDAYIKTRDELDLLKKAYDARKQDLEELQQRRETYLRGELDRLGVESFKTAHGTAFVDWKDSAAVADKDAFFNWVEGDFTERKHYLESRVSKTAVKQALDDGETLPPGVNYTKIKDVKVRRK